MNELDGPERELAQALAALQPLNRPLDYDAVVFRAGQAALRRKLRAWQASALAAAAGLAISVFAHLPGPSSPRHTGIAAPEPSWASAPAISPPAPGSYAVLRVRVLREGVEALPLPAAGGPMLSAKAPTNL